MSVAAMSWAFTHRLAPNAFVVLLTIADEADSDGACFMGQDKLAWKAGMEKRTVQRHMKSLKEEGLLHTERRTPEFGRGRSVDTIVLHLEVHGSKGEYPGQKNLNARKVDYRKSFEVEIEESEPDQPVDNSGEDQSDNLSLYCNSNDHDQSDNLSPWSTKATIRDDQGDNPCKNDPGALKRNARGLTRLSRQSVENPNERSVDKSEVRQTDGPTDQEASSGPVVHGVHLTRLRRGLGARLIGEISDQVLSAMVEIVMERASGPVKSPLSFVMTSIRLEPQELISQAEFRLETPSYDVEAWHELVAEATAEFAVDAPKAGPTRRTCPKHQVEYVTVCPGCRSDELAGDAPRACSEAEGKQFRAQLRSARASRGGER
ncbi:helix-turn-helix domain-containing protein [Kocuria sp. HSID16901]|uniref:helix-turn-helix domain-containing protein n=1 Tax=Kocuria sp. HSID16901 TaxID=2419505 RepID=UPI00066108AB|nr:helix-turn-helix domain-containing protein [Kocuria sp. HSID16901]RUQ20909.1 helix-turn-helix domain-containing protein [Kocuria sp. HSID16901]